MDWDPFLLRKPGGGRTDSSYDNSQTKGSSVSLKAASQVFHHRCLPDPWCAWPLWRDCCSCRRPRAWLLLLPVQKWDSAEVLRQNHIQITSATNWLNSGLTSVWVGMQSAGVIYLVLWLLNLPSFHPVQSDERRCTPGHTRTQDDEITSLIGAEY